MRVPGRLRIAWDNDTTLRIDTDAWHQMPLLRFDKTQKPSPTPTGSLKVVTTSLRAGDLRKNGVPYCENAVVTEYFDRLSAEGSD